VSEPSSTRRSRPRRRARSTAGPTGQTAPTQPTEPAGPDADSLGGAAATSPPAPTKATPAELTSAKATPAKATPAKATPPKVTPPKVSPTKATGQPPRGASKKSKSGDPGNRDVERNLRELVGAGPSQLSVGRALRVRDADQPTEADLAQAEADLVIVRRNWAPQD